VRGIVVAVIIAAVDGGLSACNSPPQQGCPAGATAAVAWSSETAELSHIQYASTDRLITDRTIEVQGIRPMTPVTIGRKAYLLATGNTVADQTSLVELDMNTCTTRIVPVDRRPAYTVDVAHEFFVTAANINDEAIIDRYSLDGRKQSTATIPGRLVSKVLIGDGFVYAFASGDSTTSVELIVMDAATLSIRNRVPLPKAGSSPSNALIHEGSLYFPITLLSDKEGGADHQVGRIGLSTMEFSAIDVITGMPYLISATGDYLVVGHTFMNPSMGEMANYHHISLVSWSGTSILGGEIDLGIQSMSVASNAALVLGVDSSNHARIATYTLPALRKTGEVAIGESNQWGNYHYPAAVVALR
jgi:hypothetical protein